MGCDLSDLWDRLTGCMSEWVCERANGEGVSEGVSE